MPEQPAIIETREFEHLVGFGGFLNFQWASGTDTPIPDERLDIQQWEIEHLYTNARIPMSGGRGSLSRRRICDDFRFATIVDLDLTPARKPKMGNIGEGLSNSPFYDTRLQGSAAGKWHIGIDFHCGHPTFWTNPELQSIARIEQQPGPDGNGVFYRAPRIALDYVRILNSARGQDVPGAVVTCLVKGSGSAPLERWIGNQFCGAGAFDL